MRVATALWIAGLAAATASVPARQADAQAADGSPVLVSMNHRNTDVSRLLRIVGPQLGERFLFDASLSGRVTVAVPQPVTREQAFELLRVALELRGYAAVPLAPGGYKIVPLPETP